VLFRSLRRLPATTMPEIERHGDLALHRRIARALWRGHDVALAVTEYKIVVLLVSRKGKLQTYRAIYDTAHYTGFVAGSGERGYTTNVRSLVKRIRKIPRGRSRLFGDQERTASRLPLARSAALSALRFIYARQRQG